MATKKKTTRRKNSDRLTQAQIDALPYMQRIRVDNELSGAFLRKDKAYVTKSANGTVTVHVSKDDGHSYTVVYDKKGKTLNPVKRRNKTVIRAGRIDHLDVSKVHNPGKTTRRKYRNGYLDLAIHGHAKKTPSGWSLGGKTFKQGKGIVPASRRGFYLDRATGTVFSKKARNAEHKDADHPIEVTKHFRSGPPGYMTPWQRAHSQGQQGLFDHGIKSRNPKDKAVAELEKEYWRKMDLVALNSEAIRSIRRDAKIRNLDRYDIANLKYYQKETDRLEKECADIKKQIVRRKAQLGIKARKRTNPSVKTIRKEFAGSLGKATDAFAPIGTPRNVAKLGKLLLIDTESATIKPTGIVYLCADSKGKLHLCGSKNVSIYSGAAQSFGRVKKLEYETAKPHLYPGQGVISFWHKMGEESGNQPTLYADGKGGLKFRGGSYKITREGIVD